MTKTDDIIAYIAFSSFAGVFFTLITAIICGLFGFTPTWLESTLTTISVGSLVVFVAMVILSEMRY